MEFYDGAGTRHTISLEGDITRDKVARVLDYIELMGGAAPTDPAQPLLGGPRSKFERLRDLLVARFSDRTFVTADVKAAYEEVYGERIALSTVGTYLSRLVDRGVLNRAGASAERRYALRIPPAILSGR